MDQGAKADKDGEIGEACAGDSGLEHNEKNTELGEEIHEEGVVELTKEQAETIYQQIIDGKYIHDGRRI